jgi:hypothetical protein
MGEGREGDLCRETLTVGAAVGLTVGVAVGDTVGVAVGSAVGDAVGTAVGLAVGSAVGPGVEESAVAPRGGLVSGELLARVDLRAQETEIL